jgi:hypothetical protein
LTVDNQKPGSESQDAQLGRPVDCCSFSLGEKVRMRDKPVNPGAFDLPLNKPSNTVQNETK